MDGFKQTYKQGQSFGMSTQFSGDDLPNRNKFQRYDAQGFFGLKSVKINSELPFNDTQVLIGSLGTTVGKYVSGVFCPNGFIYCIPAVSTRVLKINTINDTVSTFGSLPGASYKWQSSILYKNFVFGIPYNSTSVVRVDTLNDNIEYFGSFSGANLWYSGTLASNNYIYGSPFSSNFILKYDPINNSSSLIPKVGSGNYTSVCCIGNYLYFTPYSGRFMRLNLHDDSVDLIGPSFTADTTVSSCAAMNGFIYTAAFSNGSSFWKFDPVNGTRVSIASSVGISKYLGTTFGADGYIYCVPHAAPALSVARINPVTDIVDYLTPTTISGSLNGAYYSAVLADNSKLYFIPSTSASVGIMGINRPIDPNFPLNRHFNKL